MYGIRGVRAGHISALDDPLGLSAGYFLNQNRFDPQFEYMQTISQQSLTINKLQQTVAQQSATINKLQQEILELKTMMENVSG